MTPAPSTLATVQTTVGEAIRLLAGTSIETPRLDAEVLMAFELRWTRAKLLGHWDEELPPGAREHYLQLVRRRASGEPVAYIRNLKEFFGLDFYVDPRVLIPRPETELLVARALAVPLPSQWERLGEGTPPRRVVDVGTGSGAIAIAILHACPGATVIATDVSEDSLDVARINAERHAVAPIFVAGSLLEPVPGPVDLIVANLPYLSRDEYESLLDTSIAYEPRHALTDDADGLRWFAALLEQAPAKLSSDGCILLEIGCGQPEALQQLVRDRLPGFRTAVYADYAGLPRVLEISR